MMNSKTVITDAPKCLLRQKHAFKGFIRFFPQNGPAFKIGHTDLDDVKNIVWEVPK